MKKRSVCYVHLGENYILPLHEIVGIINLEEPISPETLDLIQKAQAEKKFYKIGKDLGAKSLIIGVHNVYQSPISSVTLYKRAMGRSWEGKNE